MSKALDALYVAAVRFGVDPLTGHALPKKIGSTMAKITYQDLTTMAKSGDPNERKRGFGLFVAWVKATPKLQDSEKLTQMEREVLTQMFEQKGLLTAERQRQLDARKRMR